MRFDRTPKSFRQSLHGGGAGSWLARPIQHHHERRGDPWRGGLVAEEDGFGSQLTGDGTEGTVLGAAERSGTKTIAQSGAHTVDTR